MEIPAKWRMLRAADTWKFCMSWIIATVLAYMLGWALSAALLLARTIDVGTNLLFDWGWALTGPWVGTMLWLVLRERLGRASWRWVPATVVGYAATSVILWKWGNSLGGDDFPVSSPLCFMTVGFSVGLLPAIGQWLDLRRHVRQASWWILASTTGWLAPLGAALVVVIALSPMLPRGSHSDPLAGIGILVLFPLLILACSPSLMGLALVRLLKRPSSEERRV